MLEDAVKQQPENDKTLATRAVQGDQAAFIALCDRHFGEVYDFLLRLLLSRPEAARAVLSTFVRLRRQLSRGSWRVSPRVEALAAAYRAATEDVGPPAARPADEAEEKKRPSPFAQVDRNRLASAAEAAQAQEEAPIIWEAAASADRTEYALLDLHLRRGLSAAEAGWVVGIGRLKAWSIIPRLKRVAEDTFVSLLVLRLGSGQCAELEQLAARTRKVILPPESRRPVRGHVAACPTCSMTRKRLVPPLEVLAALLPVPPPPGLRDTVLQNLRAYAAAQAGTGPTAKVPARAAPPWPGSMGLPPRRPPHPAASGGSLGGPAFALLVGAAAAIAAPLAALALWLGVLSDGGGSGATGAGPTSTPPAGAALEGCALPAPAGEAGAGAGTPQWITCTPSPTATPTPEDTPFTPIPTPADTPVTTPSPTATATEPPTETPLPTPDETPVGQKTPLGVVETATPLSTAAATESPTETPPPTPQETPVAEETATPEPLPGLVGTATAVAEHTPASAALPSPPPSPP